MNIRKFRENLGLTQQELADELNISRVSLSGYENGKVSTPPYIKKLIDCLFGDKKSQKIGRINKELKQENKILKEKVKFLEKKLKILESNR